MQKRAKDVLTRASRARHNPAVMPRHAHTIASLPAQIDVDHRVSITLAARIAGVSRRTIYNWMDARILPWQETPTGRRRIRVGDLFRPASTSTSRVA